MKVLKPLPEAASTLSINNDEIEIYVPLSLIEKGKFCVQVVIGQLILTAAAWFVSCRFADDSCPEALSQGLASKYFQKISQTTAVPAVDLLDTNNFALKCRICVAQSVSISSRKGDWRRLG